MKTKKILVSVLASLVTLSSVAALSSCGDGKDNDKSTVEDNSSNVPTTTPSGSVENEDLQIVNAALNKLTVANEVSTNFTLTTSSIGGVSITWSSNNEAITIDGANATVVAPTFGAEDATVTLKATAVLNDTIQTKEFTVTVKALEDDSKTIATIKGLDDKTPVTAHGVVTGFLYASGDTDPEYKKGFYLTDATGTIYVYGSNAAKTINIGDEVYFGATVSSYSGAKQIEDPTNLKVIKSNVNADYSAVIKDKTISELGQLKTSEVVGNTYELVVKVYKDSNYISYKIENPDYGMGTSNDAAFGIYFAGSASSASTQFCEDIADKVGQVIRVVFYASGTNSKGVVRGNILSVLPLTADDQYTYVKDAFSVDLDDRYTEASDVALPTTVEGFDKATVAWSLKDGSTGATLEGTTLKVTPTDELQKFTLVATITVEGKETPVVVELSEVQVKSSFDPMSFADYCASADNTKVLIGGTVVYGKGKYLYLMDNDGNGYLVYDWTSKFYDAATMDGKYIVVSGELDIYNNLYEVSSPSLVSVADSTLTVAPVDITDDVKTNGLTVTPEMQNKYVKVTGIYNGSTLTVGATTISLYANGATVDLDNGSNVEITGFLSIKSGVSQIVFYEASQVVDKTTDASKVESTKAAIEAAFDVESFTSTTTVEVPSLFDSVTTTVTVQADATTLAYDATTGEVTVTPTNNEVTETITFVVTSGAETTTFTVSVKSKINLAAEKTATLTYTASTSYSLTNNEEDITSKVTDDTNLTVSAQTNSATTHFSLYTNSIRLNNHTTSGCALVVSVPAGYTITKVVINYDTSKKGTLTVNGTVLTAVSDTHTSDTVDFSETTNTVTLQNNSSAQVRISSIVVTYKATTTSTTPDSGSTTTPTETTTPTTGDTTAVTPTETTEEPITTTEVTA